MLSSPKVSDTSQVSGTSRWAGASMTVGGRGGWFALFTSYVPMLDPPGGVPLDT